MSTLFTQIIAGDIPARFVWADDVAVVLGTIAPITDGHMLVVPRDEIVQLTEAPDDVLAHLMLVAGFEVDHLHLHVLPAWGEAELSFRNARTDVPAAELDDAAERIRAALRDRGHGAHVPATLTSPAL